ncbi:MAG: hypothetical protein A2Z91_00445 [Deltaproteobacteria bacterium GWA2_38_16]|nr:MAG: hypothetical protein A2Z91_00445 [Deltaproteobacteria bacterium GWA2_38_16]OGQ03571.1 MAG: hypothetical protein A3D19_01850 [Deltaproteobacteria bacterium RIFCSPHIGHO2_02_FULL_38_15]OGQ30151.1 MAG: hypothetical protein A3A72_01470 [Deltaproteobacteria bacterium RIFCSPLOWO2_01_FULL_38_9]OGQ64026.1 MAG: hypothetical protein A3G92_01110 [Deltaproteobacteria bacterium RIFCSPLOWO2_12_FULL_38_8]HBQ21186.1 hypothetical protein [Deltaproteobacteria bacterium]
MEKLQSGKTPTLILDSGDLLFKSSMAPDYLRAQWKDQAEFLVDQFNLIGCDAIGIGDNDFALGVDFLQELQKKAKFPFLSANIIDHKSGKTLFTPYIIKTVLGVKVGIFSVIDASLKLPESVHSQDAIVMAQEVIKELSPKVDFMIALTHQGVEKDILLAQKVKGIDFILGGHDGAYLAQPKQVGNTLIFEAGDQGKYVGVLKASLKKGVHTYASPADIQGSEGKVIQIDDQLKQLREMKKGDLYQSDIGFKSSTDRQEQELLRQKWELEQEIELSKTKGNQFTHQLIALDEQMGNGDNRIFQNVQQFKIHKIELDQKIPMDTKMGALTKKGNTLEYATYQKCKECHKTQQEVWEKSKHATAMIPLYIRNQHKNPECLICHSVGLQKPGGFSGLDKSMEVFLEKVIDKKYKGSMIELREHPDVDQKLRAQYLKAVKKENWKKDFMGVQCENCHGARGLKNAQGAFIPHFTEDQFPKKVVAQNCLECHTRQQSPHFDFAKDKRIKGEAGGAMAPFHCAEGKF